MMKRWSVGGALLCFLGVFAGCDAFLGLDDKQFGTTTTITLTGGDGGTTSTGGQTGGSGGTGTGGFAMGGTGGGTGASGGGITGGSGGGITGGSGGGITGGTGGAGTCTDGADQDRVTDEFEFPLCPGSDTGTTLKARGWHLAWQDEGYPVPPVGLSVANGNLRVSVTQSVYWFDGQAGPFVEKALTGDFLIVADVKISKGSDPASLPACSQAGAGILVRDPLGPAQGVERWIAVDRGSALGVASIHGSWSDGSGAPDQASLGTFAPPSGKIAICRRAGEFYLYSKEGNTWTPQDALLTSKPPLPDAVQAGLFIYAYDSPKISIPSGVAGTFASVHQHDLVSDSCNPADYGE